MATPTAARLPRWADRRAIPLLKSNRDAAGLEGNETLDIRRTRHRRAYRHPPSDLPKALKAVSPARRAGSCRSVTSGIRRRHRTGERNRCGCDGLPRRCARCARRQSETAMIGRVEAVSQVVSLPAQLPAAQRGARRTVSPAPSAGSAANFQTERRVSRRAQAMPASASGMTASPVALTDSSGSTSFDVCQAPVRSPSGATPRRITPSTSGCR